MVHDTHTRRRRRLQSNQLISLKLGVMMLRLQIWKNWSTFGVRIPDDFSISFAITE